MVLNHLVVAEPLNQKSFFEKKKKLSFAYPLLTVRVPQVENRWFTSHLTDLATPNQPNKDSSKHLLSHNIVRLLSSFRAIVKVITVTEC